MNGAETEQQLVDDLVGYLRSTVLHGDPAGELTDRTPLLELGLLNSLRTAALLAFARDRHQLPAERLVVTAGTVRDVRTLARALLELRT